MSLRLDEVQFLNVITNAPLVAIDLVLRDNSNNILLGRRINEPAKDKWFVPGGRIHKGETLDIAFERISYSEIGERYSRNEARFIGVFTHIYDTNYFQVKDISTHYVVLAYEIYVREEFQTPKNEQHSKYIWFPNEDKAADVHSNTLEYFNHPAQMDDTQYHLLNNRRDYFNNLVWQTPVISLTAQAFLFTIILSAQTSVLNRIIASVLACIVALASLHLFGKHRFMEAQHAKILHTYENACKSFAANREFKPTNWALRLPSYWVWRGVLWVFVIAAILSIILATSGK